MAALILRQIERSSVSFAATDTTKTITLTTTLLDTAKTLLFFNIRCDSSSPINFAVLGRVLSTTQIQFERAATPGVACVVEYQVVEFTSGINVQHFYYNQTTETVNTTVSTLTLSNSFVYISYKITGTGWAANDFYTAELTTTTNLATVVNAADSTCYIAAQVVSIDDATVQKIDTTYGTGQTKDVTLTSFDQTKTFWFFSLGYNGSVSMDNIPYLSYVDNTTVRFTRVVSSGGVNFTIKGYVVSVSSGVTVQNVATTIASSTSSISPTISPTITVASTALNISGVYQNFASSNIAGDEAGYSCFTLSGLTTSAFTATRAASPAVAATTNVQVISFSAQEPTQVLLISDFF